MTADDEAIDPVCGMTIQKKKGTAREFEGETFYLCSELCLIRFEEDAMAYVATSKLKLKGWGRTPRPGFLPDDES